ncbi:MAG: sugar ABC transporter permease [Chloroflexota bacterium]|nr:sugar ABC transporter permease [Chloroflexota bacterium]
MAVKIAGSPPRPAGGAAPTPPRRASDRVAYIYLLPVIVAAIIFTILPFIYTVYIAFTNYSLFHFQEFEFVGLENFRRIFAAGSGFVPVLGWTVTWMGLSTIFNVGVGMILAMMLNHPRLVERNVYRTLLIIPWALPVILMVQVWAGIFNNQGPLNLLLSNIGIKGPNWLAQANPARAALIMVNLWLSYPFFMTVCLAALQAIPRDLYEVADLDGAGGWARFRYITWPFMIAAITPLIITQLAFQFQNAGVIILLTAGKPLAYPGSQYGATDSLASYAYNLVFSLRQYGLSAAYGIIIFVVVSSFTIFNSIATGAFKEREA